MPPSDPALGCWHLLCGAYQDAIDRVMWCGLRRYEGSSEPLKQLRRNLFSFLQVRHVEPPPCPSRCQYY